jgi:hypothetical protein
MNRYLEMDRVSPATMPVATGLESINGARGAGRHHSAERRGSQHHGAQGMRNLPHDR